MPVSVVGSLVTDTSPCARFRGESDLRVGAGHHGLVSTATVDAEGGNGCCARTHAHPSRSLAVFNGAAGVGKAHGAFDGA